MIKVQQLTPEVYYKESRDFQFIGRIYDVVFNYLKNNVNDLNYIRNCNEVNETLIDLVINTLGFKKLHNYDIDQLRCLCSIFQEVIRNKGSKKSIETVIKMLLQVAKIKDIDTQEEYLIEYNQDTYTIDILIPTKITNLTLLYDVLDYILPAGVSANIMVSTLITKDFIDTYSNTDEYVMKVKSSAETSFIPRYEDVSSIQASDIEGGRNDNMVVMPYISDTGGNENNE